MGLYPNYVMLAMHVGSFGNAVRVVVISYSEIGVRCCKFAIKWLEKTAILVKVQTAINSLVFLTAFPQNQFPCKSLSET